MLSQSVVVVVSLVLDRSTPGRVAKPASICSIAMVCAKTLFNLLHFLQHLDRVLLALLCDTTMSIIVLCVALS